MDKKKNDSELLDGGLIKILILGDMGVGKTSLMLRYVDDQFSERHMPTIGVEFRSKTV
jgi:GTPase SAR1 and related small G proteins